MNVTVLESSVAKYMRVPITIVETETSYTNMRSLFYFIGSYNESHSSDPDVAIGHAYKLIRKKANKKVNYSWHCLKHKNLKTSKAEVKALIHSEYDKKKNTNVMKIPFKSYQLMETIIECVDELKARGIVFPEELKCFYGQLYGDVLMEKQKRKCINQYTAKGATWPANCPKRHLYDDFTNTNSPFNKVIE